jgi:hypothetical protein
MPAYSYDPYMYRLHKMNGGTFSNYTDKGYRPFTDEQLLKHLTGEQFIGIYPLLQNTIPHGLLLLILIRINGKRNVNHL